METTLDLSLVPLGIDIHVDYDSDAEMAYITYAQVNECINTETDFQMSLEQWSELLTRLDAGEALRIS